MAKVVIKECKFSDIQISENFDELLKEYANELAINGLPHPKADIELYKKLDDSGIFQVIGAFIDNKIVGIITIILSVNQHYGKKIAVTESFYVGKEYRKTGAGLKLLKHAEIYAENNGSPGLFVTAPVNGTLADILPRVGYIKSNQVFFKSFMKSKKIPTMKEEDINKVRELEKIVLQAPQIQIPTAHTIHGGVYTRTITIPKGVVLTGVLIKIPTTIIVDGDVIVYVGNSSMHINGYQVVTAAGNRKQAFYANEDTRLTMMFSTDAKTIEDAELEFTDDVGLLMSRNDSSYNEILITGEKRCLEAQQLRQ